MSVSLEILNNNNSYRTTTAKTAKSAKAAESKPFSTPVEESTEKAVANVDSFVHGGGSIRFGAYSKPMAMKNIGAETASAVSKVQAKGAKGASNVYLNVITHRAAKKAGIGVGVNGEPRIGGYSDYNSYNNAKKSIEETFWCQTGGWEKLSGDGSSECARTALATMASINSDSVVTPDKTGANMTSVRVYGYLYKEKGDYNYNYDTNNGAEKGFHTYGFKEESDLISAINTELSQKRSVEVKVTTKSGRDHWVTVTGTKSGRQANTFSDLIGVDPWFNGNNTAHGGKEGTGDYSTDIDRSGVINLESTCSGFCYTVDKTYPKGYRIATFNIDT